MSQIEVRSKKCKQCLEVKEDGLFYKNRNGLHSLCKTCYIERNKSYQKNYRSKNRFAIRMRTCRARAKEKGLPFDLTEDYLKSIWTDTCPVFGTPLNIDALKCEANHAQLDRVIPALGYVKGNVVWLSQRANRIKDDATLEDLERLVTWFKSR